MKKALVIGGTGLIGNHIVRALIQHGVRVKILSRGLVPSKNLAGLEVELVRGDLCQQDTLHSAMKGCDWVFHAAGYYPTHAFDLSHHVKQANLQIDSVLEAFKKSTASRLIYTSSLTTLGFHHLSKVATEEDVYDLARDPHPYFRVKKIMEDRMMSASTELPIIILNPTGCFGPFELKPLSLCLVPQLINRTMPAFIDGNINVVDVADVGRGHLLAALNGKVGERYILGGHDTNIREVIEKICFLGRVKKPRWKVPLAMALPLAYASEYVAHYVLKSPPLFPVLGLRFVQYGQHCSSKKAIDHLGYKISPMDVCYYRTIQWFKEIGYC